MNKIKCECWVKDIHGNRIELGSQEIPFEWVKKDSKTIVGL